MTARQTYLTHRYMVMWTGRLEGCAGAPVEDDVCARMVDNHHVRGKTLPTITSEAHIALRLRRVRIIDSTHLVCVLRVPMRILVST